MKNNRLIFSLIITYLVIFLIAPIFVLLLNGVNIDNISKLLTDPKFLDAIYNSLITSLLAATLSCILATIVVLIKRYTNTSKYLKRFVSISVSLPMLLPTIAYGFSIIYLLGNNGIFTRLLTFPIINVYSISGVVLAFLIYVLGPVYLIIDNGFKYLDGNLYHVSKIYNNTSKDVIKHVLFPNLKNSYVSAFFIAFVLAFTDYGIPMSLNFTTASKYLYTTTLGAIPDFNKGSLVAIILLIIPLISYIFIQIANRKQHLNNDISPLPLRLSNKTKRVLQLILLPWIFFVISNFIIILVVPFFNSWPYNLTIDLSIFTTIFRNYNLFSVILMTLRFALLSVLVGSTLTFISAYYVSRSTIKNKKILDYISILSNLVPGMSLGLAYLLLTKKTNMDIALFLMVTCNVVHYFASPYMLFKNSLERLNPNLEKIVYIFGYSKRELIFNVLLPNIKTTIVEVAYYIFISSMTTLSAIIFLASYSSTTLSITIKSLQSRNDFRGIFVVSIVILIINLIMLLVKKGLLKKLEGDTYNEYS